MNSQQKGLKYISPEVMPRPIQDDEDETGDD